MLTDKKALGFKDVLIEPRPSDIRSRKEVSLERTFKFQNGKELTCVPIIAANMANIGTIEVARVLSKYKMLTCLHKGWTYDSLVSQPKEVLSYCIPTIGLEPNSLEVLSWLPVSFVCLDVANGYMKQFVDFVGFVRAYSPKIIIMAGNVATAEGAEKLYEAGADIVKVGLGSGSVCTTRFKTGVGVPQITAVDDCKRYDERGKYFDDRYICSDGGCTSPGDIAKAFVAGADFVMLGGMLAGYAETGYEFQGSAYRTEIIYTTSEGKSVKVGDGSPLEDQIKDILGGLRSAGSYIGERKIEDFYKANLIQVTEQTNNVFGGPC